jgi:hypothetical protein
MQVRWRWHTSNCGTIAVLYRNGRRQTQAMRVADRWLVEIGIKSSDFLEGALEEIQAYVESEIADEYRSEIARLQSELEALVRQP